LLLILVKFKWKCTDQDIDLTVKNIGGEEKGSLYFIEKDTVVGMNSLLIKTDYYIRIEKGLSENLLIKKEKKEKIKKNL
jgi:hypothetical protein